MANIYNQNPIILDTDTTSWGANQTLQSKPFGIRPYKIMLVAASSTSAGSVSITNPVDSSVLYPAIPVAATQAANTVVMNDNIDNLLTWKDFAVTGLTATATKLYIWYRS